MANPNPFLDSAPFGAVLIGGVDIGLVLSIDGAEKPEEWAVQKGTGTSGATTVWRGTKIAEAIKLVVAAIDVAGFDNLYAVRDALRPQPGQKPPSLDIVNPIVNFNAISRVSQSNIGQPKHVSPGNYWTVEVTLTEFRPSAPANTGPAGWTQSRGGPSSNPNDDLAKQLQDSVDAAAKAGGA